MNRIIAKIPKGFSKKINKTGISNSEVEKIVPNKSFSKSPHIPTTNSNVLYFPPHPDYQGSNIFSHVINVKKSV